MQKAVMVKMYQDVEELNKLFDEGYTVERLDDNGVYILNLTNLETNPITKEESVMVNLDTSKAIKAMKLLEDTANKLKEKQPHVRIEFDDTRDEPKVWVDGERDYDYNNNHAVVILEKHY